MCAGVSVWLCWGGIRVAGCSPQHGYHSNPTTLQPKFTWAEGITGLIGETGLMEEEWNDRGQLEEEHNIIVKWAQENVKKLYSQLNNIYNYDAAWPYLQLRQHRGPHLLLIVVSRQQQCLAYQVDSIIKTNKLLSGNFCG